MNYNKESLIKHCSDSLQKMNVSKADSDTVASVLVSADSRGVSSHGCVRMQGYVECLKSKGIVANPTYKTVSEGPSHALIDAGQGLGIPVSVMAETIAIKKAKENGIAIVNVNNSHHHGACGYYSLMAAKEGLIGLTMSTGDIIMAVTGSSAQTIGNNPFSYAVPAGKYGNICYDIAMSTVAAGKISMAADEGRSIPLGWLLDPLGNETTDPKDYAKGGALMPFGGYKGYGLSMMVESLAGMLSGAALLKDIHAWNKNPEQSGNVGHCFIAIDPHIINPGFDLVARSEKMLDEILSSPKAPGVEKILFPGQLEQIKEARSFTEGIVLPPATEHALRKVADITGITFEPDSLAMK